MGAYGEDEVDSLLAARERERKERKRRMARRCRFMFAVAVSGYSRAMV
jgi:hypothetical protein